MHVFCLIAVLLLSMGRASIAQLNDFHITGPGAKQKFVGVSHIEVDLGQGNTLLVGFDRYSQLQARKNIDSLLRLFVADFQKVEDTTQSLVQATHAVFRPGETDRRLVLRYTPQRSLSFRFSEDDEPLLVKTQQDTLQIVWTSATTQSTPDEFSVYLLVNKLPDIGRMLPGWDINQKMKQAMESAQAYKGHDLTSPRMAFTMVKSLNKNAKIIHPGLAKNPFISFHPGIGVGVIRNQLVPSFSLDAQFIPSRFHNVGYSLGYVSNFFFGQSATDGSFQPFRNDFLTVGVAFYQFNKDRRTSSFSRQTASFFVGIPVHRRENYFDANTIRLSGTVYQKGLLNVQPEMYMNGFFRNVYPGLRLTVGF